MQHTPKSLVMTSKFEKRLATVNGVVVTSKIPQGGQLHKKKPWTVKRAGRDTKTIMTCSICNSTCRDLRELRGHFVVCVDRNGNPYGARWDDCLTPDDAANLRYDTLPSLLSSLVNVIQVESQICCHKRLNGERCSLECRHCGVRGKEPQQ